MMVRYTRSVKYEDSLKVYKGAMKEVPVYSRIEFIVSDFCV